MFQVIILHNKNQLKTYKVQLQFILVLSKSKIVDSTHKLVILKIHRIRRKKMVVLTNQIVDIELTKLFCFPNKPIC